MILMADTRNSEKLDRRIICFERPGNDEAFESSMMELMARVQRQTRKMFVSEHNVLRMKHGGSWVHTARDQEPDTTVHTISAELLVPFKDIANNDLSLINRTLDSVNKEMEKQFAQNMYGIVGAAAERVGNVVSAQATKSFHETFLEALNKVEFSVDRNGKISMPQLHVNPETAERIARETQNTPPEILAKIEKVQAEKTQAALAREAERKSKFKKAKA